MEDTQGRLLRIGGKEAGRRRHVGGERAGRDEADQAEGAGALSKFRKVLQLEVGHCLQPAQGGPFVPLGHLNRDVVFQDAALRPEQVAQYRACPK